jgi:uncharacterized protein YndB with AHSA1/START domain
MRSDGRIRREVVLPWSRDRVWQTLTKPEQLGQWLAPVIRIELEPGGTLYCAWPNDDDETEGRVMEVEEERSLTFAWRPFGQATREKVPEDVTTTLTFSLADHVNGTLVGVDERGFADLPSGISDRAYADNEFGWDEALYRLRHYLTKDEEDARETER